LPSEQPSARPTHRPSWIVETIHRPTQSPTVKHGKVSHSPTAKPNGKADDDTVYTVDDQIYYGETGYEASGKQSKSSGKSSKSKKSGKSKKSSKKSGK